MANADILPFEFQHFRNAIKKYIDEVTKLADDLREETEKENRLIDEGFYALASNPKEKFVVPEPREEVPYFNFAPLQNALEELTRQASAFEKASQNIQDDFDNAKELNTLLKDMERSLLLDQGLPNRPWFRHHIYAPGIYTGYDVKTLPGVREAIELREYDRVNGQVEILAEVMMHFSKKIENAVNLMQ